MSSLFSCDKAAESNSSENKFIGEWFGNYLKVQEQDTMQFLHLEMHFFSEDSVLYIQNRVQSKYQYNVDSLLSKITLTQAQLGNNPDTIYLKAQYDYHFFNDCNSLEMSAFNNVINSNEIYLLDRE